MKCQLCGHINTYNFRNDPAYQIIFESLERCYNFPEINRWMRCGEIAAELGFPDSDRRRVSRVLRALNVPSKRASDSVYFGIPNRK